MAAPGVQANDLATNGQPFSSVLVNDPSHGHVTLDPDGSFTYKPDKNFVGTDSFTYEDVQGSVVSNVATVTIDVNPKTSTPSPTPTTAAPARSDRPCSTPTSPPAPRPTRSSSTSRAPGRSSSRPLTPLPTLTHATIIDGYSQPGSHQNTFTGATTP